MRKRSIIRRINLIFIMFIMVIGIILVYIAYFWNMRNIAQENNRTVETTFDLMDNTLTLLYQQVEGLIGNISLSKEVRYYYQDTDDNESIEWVENAKRCSEYIDTLQSASSIIKVIKLYKLDGELIYRAGSSPIEVSWDLMPENIRVMLDNQVGRQYWMRGVSGEQEVVRVFSYLYNFQTLQTMGILEVQIPAGLLFLDQKTYLNQDLEIFLAQNEEDYIWKLGKMQNEEIYEVSREKGKFADENGQYSVYQRESRSGVGTFYLVNNHEGSKRMNQEFLLYLIGIFLLISVFIVVIASGIIRRMLIPVEQLTNLVNGVNVEIGLQPQEQKQIDNIKSRTDEIGILAISFEKLFKRIADDISDSLQMNRNKRKLELELLMSQIKPHFLYNTIEAICGMALLGKNEDIIRITESLGIFYRISLSKGELVLPVRMELEHIKRYLDIECVRSNYSFNYYVNVEEGIGNMPILKMVLQPLVENAVVHGIFGMEEKGGVITVTAKRMSDEGLQFEIMDNGKGMEPEIVEKLNSGKFRSDEKNGFGMKNVYERIQMYYTGECALCYESEVGIGTKVTLYLSGKLKKEE